MARETTTPQAARLLAALSEQPHALRPRHEYDVSYAVEGEPISVEVWRRASALGDRTEPVGLRIGSVLLLDASAHDALPEELRKEIADEVVLVDSLGSSSLAEFEVFTVTTLLHLREEDLSGRRVIDVGSGSGEISLVAARLGASRLDLVDIDEALLARAVRNLRRAGLCEGADFRLHRRDLADPEGLAESLGPWPGGTTIVSNVGHWPRSYAVSNEHTFALLPHLPDVDRIIAGGYASWAADGGLEHLENDRRLLAAAGFSTDVRVSSWRREYWPGSDSPIMNDRRRALAARKRI